MRAPGRRASASARDRALDAALKAFGEKGFDGTTTKEIADLAGVNEVTLFRLFGSKKGLFAAVIAERGPLGAVVEAVTLESKGSVDAQIANNIRTVLHTLRQHRHLFMVLLGDAWRHPKTRAMVAEVAVDKGLALVASFISSQMDAGRLRKADPVVTARALMGMVQAYFITTELLAGKRPTPEEDERIIRGFVSLFLDGMRAGGEEA
ncbi:MAG: TetR/AcrR family transcriptional regulator [Thermoplasmata archaeon]|jgi:AcrR family transcriptional regulator|nr:TetR/AcrR family transcriptional regulator [Thermoplasmata archaeon]